MPDAAERRPNEGPALNKDHGEEVKTSISAPTELATGPAPGRVYISRGSVGDCCILCGLVGVDLPDLHGCVPDLSEADLARLHESAVVTFEDLFPSARRPVGEVGK